MKLRSSTAMIKKEEEEKKCQGTLDVINDLDEYLGLIMDFTLNKRIKPTTMAHQYYHSEHSGCEREKKKRNETNKTRKKIVEIKKEKKKKKENQRKKLNMCNMMIEENELFLKWIN